VREHRCFQVGGHTLEHTDLTSISEKEARKELSSCARRFEEELGFHPRYFSFCYGRTSELLRQLAAEAGFEAACGGEGLNPVIEAPANIFRLPRIAAPASMELFDLVTSASNTGIWRRLGR
jgi:peptidoglycan/xylan/chitin deacetylase (PgdA/CDA1 family)